MAEARSLTESLLSVRDGYIGATRELAASGPAGQRWRVRGEPAPDCVRALEEELRAWFTTLTVGRSVEYIVKASAGQWGRRYTLIPYVMLLRMDVTDSPTHGVYLAALFSEDCQTVSLTLNQGVSQFRDRFGVRRSFAALKQAAALIRGMLRRPRGFDDGPVNLGATYPYGQAYEVGAIFSRTFNLSAFDEDATPSFSEALRDLIGVYEAVPLAIAKDPSIAGNHREPDEDERHFQDTVNSKASLPAASDNVDVRKQPPKRKAMAAADVFVRDASVAATAVRAAGHKCEAPCTNEPFVSSSTGLPYVEAHHLVPLSEQANFEDASLDVPANVVALCATCHAKVHLAIKATREPLIAALHARRRARLSKCGIECDLPRLLQMYRRRQ